MVSVVSGKVCFNSTLVQLKGWCRMKTAWTEKCFNSTLVQLKGISTSLFFWDILQFQFYLSSIKS